MEAKLMLWGLSLQMFSVLVYSEVSTLAAQNGEETVSLLCTSD